MPCRMCHSAVTAAADRRTLSAGGANECLRVKNLDCNRHGAYLSRIGTEHIFSAIHRTHNGLYYSVQDIVKILFSAKPLL